MFAASFHGIKSLTLCCSVTVSPYLFLLCNHAVFLCFMAVSYYCLCLAIETLCSLHLHSVVSLCLWECLYVLCSSESRAVINKSVLTDGVVLIIGFAGSPQISRLIQGHPGTAAWHHPIHLSLTHKHTHIWRKTNPYSLVYYQVSSNMRTNQKKKNGHLSSQNIGESKARCHNFYSSEYLFA